MVVLLQLPRLLLWAALVVVIDFCSTAVSAAFVVFSAVVGVSAAAFLTISHADDDCVAVDVDVVTDTAFAVGGANKKREEIYRYR